MCLENGERVNALGYSGHHRFWRISSIILSQCVHDGSRLDNLTALWEGFYVLRLVPAIPPCTGTRVYTLPLSLQAL